MSSLVYIVLGSKSDAEYALAATDVLTAFGVKAKVFVASAHRSPKYLTRVLGAGRKEGVQVYITAAGMAAALSGVVASQVLEPVIGVPLDAGALDGMDALLSIVQMPPGVPVATMGLGKAGMKNAAYLAVRILALCDARLAAKLKAHHVKQEEDIERANKERP
ncbi:MAG: 5-(carboxyamino)imidazole ribonucleotide mutase [Elusimicrobiota bacterium]